MDVLLHVTRAFGPVRTAILAKIPPEQKAPYRALKSAESLLSARSPDDAAIFETITNADLASSTADLLELADGDASCAARAAATVARAAAAYADEEYTCAIDSAREAAELASRACGFGMSLARL